LRRRQTTPCAVVGLYQGSGNHAAGAVRRADATTVTRIYETPFTGGSAGARAVSDGNGQYYLDWQVPLARLTTASGGTITASTPVKLFFGSSQAANLATINKDYMTGTAVSFAGLATTSFSPAGLNLATSASVVSGPDAPEPTETTTYDITITATNPGAPALGSPAMAFSAGSGVPIVSLTSATGTVSSVGQDVTWNPSTIPAMGGTRTMTIRVSVTPGCGDLMTS
jgi:hypothetical protein